MYNLNSMQSQLRIQGGGGKGGGRVPLLSLLKLVIKKMATIRGALYFMFLAHPGSDAESYNEWNERWKSLAGPKNVRV